MLKTDPYLTTIFTYQALWHHCYSLSYLKETVGNGEALWKLLVSCLVVRFVLQHHPCLRALYLVYTVQDVVGSFAMIVVTYQIMLLFGPYDLDASDMCGSESR
jgi:hypothetical protein